MNGFCFMSCLVEFTVVLTNQTGVHHWHASERRAWAPFRQDGGKTWNRFEWKKINHMEQVGCRTENGNCKCKSEWVKNGYKLLVPKTQHEQHVHKNEMMKSQITTWIRYKCTMGSFNTTNQSACLRSLKLKIKTHILSERGITRSVTKWHVHRIFGTRVFEHESNKSDVLMCELRKC